MNRLTGFGGQTVSFDNKGNITEKSGIGNYHYLSNNKPYALTGIVQSGSVIPERQQIPQGFQPSEGWKPLPLANQYELDEKPGSTREKLYLGGDYYIARPGYYYPTCPNIFSPPVLKQSF